MVSTSLILFAMPMMLWNMSIAYEQIAHSLESTMDGRNLDVDWKARKRPKIYRRQRIGTCRNMEPAWRRAHVRCLCYLMILIRCLWAYFKPSSLQSTERMASRTHSDFLSRRNYTGDVTDGHLTHVQRRQISKSTQFALNIIRQNSNDEVTGRGELTIAKRLPGRKKFEVIAGKCMGIIDL